MAIVKNNLPDPREMNADVVLTKIKAISGRSAAQGDVYISIDTLTLALGIREDELMPHIAELQEDREIVYRPRTTTATSKKNMGSVMLVK